MQGFGDKSLMQRIGDMFELHPLLLEDVVNVPQRPKTEAYGDQLLIVVRMVRNDAPGNMDMEQVSIVLAKNYVLTFQERHGDVLDPVRRRIRSGKGPLRQLGADYLPTPSPTQLSTAIIRCWNRLEIIWKDSKTPSSPIPHRVVETVERNKNRLVNLRRGFGRNGKP